jgi:hypothetical protein
MPLIKLGASLADARSTLIRLIFCAERQVAALRCLHDREGAGIKPLARGARRGLRAPAENFAD